MLFATIASVSDEIVSYIELNDSFEHVYVWAPSYSPTGQGETSESSIFMWARYQNLDPALFSQMQETYE
jgi:hypothetical protein